jgi:2'-phosphotransferase
MVGGRKRGGHNDDRNRLPRNVQISKKLSWLLRHGAEKEGLKLGPGGYVNVKEVVGLLEIGMMRVLKCQRTPGKF